MDPSTLNLILFAEQMAALLAKTVADIRATITGASTKAADDILADADATYQQIIDNAKTNPPTAPPTTPTP
jgi:vacuolar-type H+-ATPase subunit E/Vma4